MVAKVPRSTDLPSLVIPSSTLVPLVVPSSTLVPLVIPSSTLVPLAQPSTDSSYSPSTTSSSSTDSLEPLSAHSRSLNNELDALSASFTISLVLSPTMNSFTTESTEDDTRQVVYVQSSHKFPSPERFSGSQDGFSCLAWLSSIKFYVEAINCPKSQWTRIAVSHLTSAAILWWQSSGIAASADFQDFEDGLRMMFLPENFFDTVRIRLYKAKLTSTVPALIQEMRMCMDILHPSPSEETRKELELAAKSILLSALPIGLQEMLQAFLIANPNPTWQQFAEATTRYAKIRRVSSNTTQAIHNSLASAHATHTAYDPMAMEIDNVGHPMAAMMTAINNLTLQMNNLQQQSRNRIGKLTHDEREVLKKNNGCFRCRVHEAGHFAANCPPKSSKQLVHNLSMTNEGGFPSGNAPGN